MTSTKTEKPRLDLSALEWRLVLIAALAIAYVVAWFGVETRPAQAPPVAGPPAEPGPPPPVWLDALPEPARPSFSVPAGWTLAPERAPSSPRSVVRAPGAAPRRIRTRSS